MNLLNTKSQKTVETFQKYQRHSIGIYSPTETPKKRESKLTSAEDLKIFSKLSLSQRREMKRFLLTSNKNFNIMAPTTQVCLLIIKL